MSEQTQHPVLMNITPTIVKAKFNLELAEVGFQKIQSQIDSLEIREDNLDESRKLLEKEGEIIKKLEAIHKSGKAPYWEIGKMYDTALSDMKKVVTDIFATQKAKFTSVSEEVSARKKREDAEKKRKEEIQAGIEKNLTYWSQQIAAASSHKDLISIQAKINAECGLKTKYAEFHDEAVEKYTTLLNGILKDQKQKYKEKEDLEAQQKAAEQSGDDAAVMEIMDKKEALETSLEENKVVVQENVLEALTAPSAAVEATPITPTVKPKRQTWKWEVADIKATNKKMPDWVKLVIDEDKVDEYLKAKKAEGIEEGVEQFEFAGIRFYLEKKFI